MNLTENKEILKHMAHRLLRTFTHAEEDRFEEQAKRRPYILELVLHEREPLFSFVLMQGARTADLVAATSRFTKIAEAIFAEDEIIACALRREAVSSRSSNFSLVLK
jgi:hypothetical protein